MIDIVRSIAAAAAIQTPPFVDAADTQSSPASSPSRFRISYFFARVLRDLSVTLEVGD